MTWALLAFAFVNLAGATVAVALLAPRDLSRSAPAYAARFALGQATDDSWMPMRRALEHIRSGRVESIYQSVFFEQKIKFQYPPSSLLALDLFQALTGRAAPVALLNRISWLSVLVLAALVPAIYLHAMRMFNPVLCERFSRRDVLFQAAVVCLMTMTFYPVTRGFYLGQIQTGLTCLFAGAVFAWICDSEALSGVLIGLIASVKPQVAIVLLWGAVQRRRRFLAAGIATLLVLDVVSLWRYGLKNHLDYLAVLSYMSAHGESFFANQSVNGLLARLLHVGNNLEWDARGFPPYHPVVYYATLVSSILLVGLALFWARKWTGTRATTVKLTLAGLVATMASPLAWEHHYGLLVAVYAVVLPHFLAGREPRKWLLLLGGSYILTSNAYPFTNYAAETPWNFVQSYVLAGAALLVAAVCLRRLDINRGASPT